MVIALITLAGGRVLPFIPSGRTRSLDAAAVSMPHLVRNMLGTVLRH